MNKLMVVFFFVFHTQATILYLNDGRVIEGKLVVKNHVIDRSRSSFRFMQHQRLSNSVPLTINKSYLDSIVSVDTTYHFVKGALVEDIQDTSVCLFNLDKSKWKKGIYRTYAEMYYNSPSIEGSWQLVNAEVRLSSQRRKDVRLSLAYYLFDTATNKRKEIKGVYWGYCDGENIYYQSESYLTELLVDDQFLFVEALKEISVSKGISGIGDPHFVPTSNIVSTPGGSFTVNTGSMFMGGSGGSVSVKIMVFESLLIARHTGIVNNVLCFQTSNFAGQIESQPELHREYNAISQSVITANPFIKTKFFLRYLDLTDSPWFAWHEKYNKVYQKGLEEYE